MRIYVQGISGNEAEVRQTFERFGEVASVNLINRETPPAGYDLAALTFSPNTSVDDRIEPPRFAFVEMPDRNQGLAAISALNGSELNGRALVLSEARALVR